MLATCPKCKREENTDSVSQETSGQVALSGLCACQEYPESHFHYACVFCGFKAIMRTADAG